MMGQTRTIIMSTEATVIIQVIALLLTLSALSIMVILVRRGSGKPFANLLFALALLNLTLFLAYRVTDKLLSPSGPAWDWINQLVQSFGVNQWAIAIQLHFALTFFIASVLYLRNGTSHHAGKQPLS